MKVEVDRELLVRLRKACDQMSSSGGWDQCPACGGFSPRLEDYGVDWAWHEPDCAFKAGYDWATAALKEV